MMSSVDLAHYGVSRAKDKVSVVCGINKKYIHLLTLCDKMTICDGQGAVRHGQVMY